MGWRLRRLKLAAGSSGHAQSPPSIPIRRGEPLQRGGHQLGLRARVAWNPLHGPCATPGPKPRGRVLASHRSRAKPGSRNGRMSGPGPGDHPSCKSRGDVRQPGRSRTFQALRPRHRRVYTASARRSTCRRDRVGAYGRPAFRNLGDGNVAVDVRSVHAAADGSPREDRGLAAKGAMAARKFCGHLVGPEHTGYKLGALHGLSCRHFHHV